MIEFKDFATALIGLAGGCFIAVTVILTLARDNLFPKKRIRVSATVAGAYFAWYADAIVVLSSLLAFPALLCLCTLAVGVEHDTYLPIVGNGALLLAGGLGVATNLWFVKSAFAAREDDALFPFAIVRLLISACVMWIGVARISTFGQITYDVVKNESVELVALGLMTLVLYLIGFGATALLGQPTAD